MALEMRSTRNKNFRFAAVLSLTTHLFFVASVEGAVFLNKVFWVKSPEPFFYFQTASGARKPTVQVEETQSGKIEIPFPGAGKKSSSVGKRVSVSLPKQNPVEEVKERSGADTIPFSKSQLQIDKKIDKIKRHLNRLNKKAMDEKLKRTVSTESLVPYVSGLEKVPSAARRDLLPGYLKKMRRQIASVWLLTVQAGEVSSGSVTVRYRIRPDGSVFDLQALSFEAGEVFRSACLSAVREASPFEPLPFSFSSWLQDPYLTIELTFFLERSKKKGSIR